MVEGDRLWFCTNRREVICLDVGPLRRGAGDPRVVWKLDMVKEFDLDPAALHIAGHDTHGSPAAYKSFLYVPTGNGIRPARWRIKEAPAGVTIACLRKDTGTVVWAVNSPSLRALWDPGNEVYGGREAFPLGYRAVKDVLAHVHDRRNAIGGDDAGRGNHARHMLRLGRV